MCITSDLTILYEAVMNGDKEKILHFLDNNTIDLTTTDDEGNTLLHLAFENKKSSQTELIEILKILLDTGIDINSKNWHDKTILHLATERKFKDIIDFCIQRNADLQVSDSHGNTIAHFVIEEECKKLHFYVKYCRAVEEIVALENESSNFVDWMVSKEFDFFQKKNRNDFSAIYLANDLNLQHILLTLLKCIMDLSTIENDKNPLLCAFLERQIKSYQNSLEPIPSYFYESRYSHEIVKIILEKSKTINDETLVMALHTIIARSQDMNMIELLLERVTSVAYHRISEESLIHTFTNRFYVWIDQSKTEYAMKILQNLILKGADINERDKMNETMAVKLFSRYPKLEMLRLLKEGGADLCTSTQFGDKFLHLISRYSKETGLVDLVMKGHCDINATNNQGETPLQLAIKYDNTFVAKDLIEQGAKFDCVNSNRETILTMACASGQVEIVQKLIKFGADLEFRDEYGRPLLHFAVDSPEVVELLVKNGANVNAKDSMGKRPLHRAMTGSVIKTLFNFGAHVDILDMKGHSPLYDAISRRNSATIEELLKFGADIRDPKVFKVATNYFEQNYSIDDPEFLYLEYHIIKMIAAGLLKDIADVYNETREDFQKFAEICRKEVELLQNFFINDRISLYNFLHKNQNRRCVYVNNEKLKNLIEYVSIEQKFPNYFVVVIGCYNQAKTRKSLLQKAICILTNIMKIILPDICTDKIFINLSNADLLRFIDAYENVNVDDSDSSINK